MTSDTTIPIDRWLRHLKRHLKVARLGIDPEGVHQVRVATRRVDAWLVLGGWRVFRDDLRWLRDRASAVRDIDVLLLRKGLPRSLKPPLMARKRQFHAEFILACDDPRLAALMVGLTAIHPIDEAEARKHVHSLFERVFECGKELEENGLTIEAMHRLRRALRRLRYGLEFLEKSTAPLKRLQEMLGNLNDLAVALRSIDQLPADKTPAKFRAALDDELALSLPLARGLWIDEKNSIKGMVD
jgi:CHAD domain-containing protein